MHTIEDIIEQFSTIYKKAESCYSDLGIDNFNAFSLSTVINNQPSSRMLLLKDFSMDGFIFYTNADSRKAVEFYDNPKVSALFYWNLLHTQVRIEGVVKEIDHLTATNYFNSRPYLSKIGAWASLQSKVMQTKKDLPLRIAQYIIQYPLKVPKPDYWKGFIIIPHQIEFWKEQKFRLHVRNRYTKMKESEHWKLDTLYP